MMIREACGFPKNRESPGTRFPVPVSKQATNPYRSILRRHLPEPLLALLIFVMGVWLWDNHFGPKYGWEDGVGRMALRKIDRDLRLADSAGDLPMVLRKLLVIPAREEALKTGVLSLEMLERDRSLDEEGAFALGVLRSARSGEGTFVPLPPDPQAVLRRVAQGTDSWWDREYLTRAWLREPESGDSIVSVASRQRSTGPKGDWNGEYYVSFGDTGKGRSWADARKYGFISGGGG